MLFSFYFCMYFHLVPLESLSRKTHGPRDALKTRFPLKTQILSVKTIRVTVMSSLQTNSTTDSVAA